MKETSRRDFQVRYYEKDGNPETWIAESHLSDEHHDITVAVEIDMPQMVITGAAIRFDRKPSEHCLPIEQKAAELIGLKVDEQFSPNVMRLFLGPRGCPNVMTLLTVAVPGIQYYYYPYLIRTGKMTQEQFFIRMKETQRDACFAHSALFAETPEAV
jgi:hypothetical protein